jgi:hypothetical protein
MQREARRSKKYRDRAEECRRLAGIANDQELRASYEALAQSYDSLANQADALNEIGPPLSESKPPPLAAWSSDRDGTEPDTTDEVA